MCAVPGYPSKSISPLEQGEPHGRALHCPPAQREAELSSDPPFCVQPSGSHRPCPVASTTLSWAAISGAHCCLMLLHN